MNDVERSNCTHLVAATEKIRFIPKLLSKRGRKSPHPLPHFPLKLLTQEVKKYSPSPRLEKTIPEVTLKSLYPPPEGKCGRFYRFDIRNIDIANWDRPWLSELDVTSGISEIKLLISDFSIVDFRFSGIAIWDF